MPTLKTFRIIVTPLLVIPALQLLFSLIGAPSFYFQEEATAELLYLVIGLSIMLANVLAWGATQTPSNPNPAAEPAPQPAPADSRPITA